LRGAGNISLPEIDKQPSNKPTTKQQTRNQEIDKQASNRSTNIRTAQRANIRVVSAPYQCIKAQNNTPKEIQISQPQVTRQLITRNQQQP
jgi:hypothetical protein